MTRKIGRLINESAFVSLNYVTWPIRNIAQNPRSVRLSRYFESFLVFEKVQILYIYIYIYKEKLATKAEGDPKAPFSIATTPRYWWGCNFFLWIAPLSPWYISYNNECWATRYQLTSFEFLAWLDMGLNPDHPSHWWTLYLLGQWAYIYIYIGSISSLMQISLNIIDILCLHIFFWIRSNSRITFIVFGGNWFMYCPLLYVSLVLSARLWAIIRAGSITKVM